jgi:methanogenic corrinoid protein MtbC1
MIKRVLDQGHRAGRVVGLGIEQLERLANATPAAAMRRAAPSPEYDALIDEFMGLVKSQRVSELRRALSQNLLRIGLGRFVTQVVAPMNERVGQAWARGAFQVFEEHLYTESMQSVLRNAINTVPEEGARPRVLLTTLPFEAHGLGLLMAEALLVLEGAHAVSLGVQTPVSDVVQAARAQRSDIVALSFSSAHAPNSMLDGVNELRRMLPTTVELWVGGSQAALQRRAPGEVHVLRALEDITPALARWRAVR